MIRPLDLQNSILQSIQSASSVQHAEEGPRLNAQAAQAAFAADVTRRDESVAQTSEVVGNRIGAKSEREKERKPRAGKHRLADTSDDLADTGAGFGEEPTHLVDVLA